MVFMILISVLQLLVSAVFFILLISLISSWSSLDPIYIFNLTLACAIQMLVSVELIYNNFIFI
jgi:hypothetical protein